MNVVLLVAACSRHAARLEIAINRALLTGMWVKVERIPYLNASGDWL
jgi:hypothetical protein